jgi:hypothetical protein
MLSEAIIRIGRPIKEANDLPPRERIRLLTDVSATNCKNYFQNVFVVELAGEDTKAQLLQVGILSGAGASRDFTVDEERACSFPVSYPNGGNPLLAQGVYPLPCYLLFNQHIKAFANPEEFASNVLLPRINSTIGYREKTDKERESIARAVSEAACKVGAQYIDDSRQLGILMVFDDSLPVYSRSDAKCVGNDALWIAHSLVNQATHLCLQSKEALKAITAAKFAEASELGSASDAISSFTNRIEERVVSIYNKSWLWLSPTWEMPRSIYWAEEDWTKGIKVDFESYESFVYGVQFLKSIQVPISSSILKEMFAPVMSAEAKKHLRPSSFEAIFGLPLITPLLEGDSQQDFEKYWTMLRKSSTNDNDLHLEVLAGLKGSIVPQTGDEHRLTILYYSGELSRGNMHIRAVIEDVLPSVASRVQALIRGVNATCVPAIHAALGLADRKLTRTETLPALLGNAFGPGYMWSSLHGVLHRQPLRIERLQKATATKLNEMANRDEQWEMRSELAFYLAFAAFLGRYNATVLNQAEGVKDLKDWQALLTKYNCGEISIEDVSQTDTLGFVSGLLIRQYERSYYMATKKKEYLKQRVMKFGSKLTPEMIWKNGLLRCEELAKQWDIKLAPNFRPILAMVLLGLLNQQNSGLLHKDADQFITTFWSGYLLYKKPEGETEKEDEDNGN